jgi:hypothetical protein
MIIVTAEMSPRHNIFGSNDGRRPSQPDEKMRNVLDTTQALEVMASCLVEDWSTYEEKGLQVEERVALSIMSIISLCLRET